MPVTSPVITTLNTLGQTLTPQPPIQSAAGGAWEVRVDNITQFALQVVVGGTAYWLMPLSAGIYKQTGPVELSLFAAASVGAVLVPQIFLTWAEHPDTIPPSIPASAGITTSTVSGGSVPFSGARDYLSANQPIPSGVFTKVPFDQQIFDTTVYYSVGLSRWIVPAGKAGYYLIEASVFWTASAAGTVRNMRLYKNGSVFSQASTSPPTGAAQQSIRISDVASLAVGDYIEVFVFQDTGAPLNIIGGLDATFGLISLLGT